MEYRGRSLVLKLTSERRALLEDATYDIGRYGVFVKAGPTQNYTYIINQIRVWDRSGL